MLKSPPHLKFAATLPCDLSLNAMHFQKLSLFSDFNISQGSVAT